VGKENVANRLLIEPSIGHDNLQVNVNERGDDSRQCLRAPGSRTLKTIARELIEWAEEELRKQTYSHSAKRVNFD
jgi:hypothetical protein